MNENRGAEHWLQQWFARVDGRIVCVICGAIVDRSWRSIHAQFHGKQAER